MADRERLAAEGKLVSARRRRRVPSAQAVRLEAVIRRFPAQAEVFHNPFSRDFLGTVRPGPREQGASR